MEVKLIEDKGKEVLAIVVTWEELADFIRKAITVEAKNKDGYLWSALPIINVALFEAMRHEIPTLDRILKQISHYLLLHLGDEKKDKLLRYLESETKYWRGRLDKQRSEAER